MAEIAENMHGIDETSQRPLVGRNAARRQAPSRWRSQRDSFALTCRNLFRARVTIAMMFETWTELARAATPDGDELILRRRGDEFDIRFNGWELMASRTSRSEEALARLVCGELPRPPRNVLI